MDWINPPIFEKGMSYELFQAGTCGMGGSDRFTKD